MVEHSGADRYWLPWSFCLTFRISGRTLSPGTCNPVGHIWGSVSHRTRKVLGGPSCCGLIVCTWKIIAHRGSCCSGGCKWCPESMLSGLIGWGNSSRSCRACSFDGRSSARLTFKWMEGIHYSDPVGSWRQWSSKKALIRQIPVWYRQYGLRFWRIP